MADVFISYSSEDKERTEQLVAELEKNSISCWVDRNNIATGSYFGEEVPEAILDCPIFMLLLSESSQKSKYVLMELDWATSHDKDIIPVVISDCEIVPKFGFLLQNKQRYHAFNGNILTINKMVSQIKTLLSIADVHQSCKKSIVELAHDYGIKCPGCGSTHYVEHHDFLDFLASTENSKRIIEVIFLPCMIILMLFTISLALLSTEFYPQMFEQFEKIQYENLTAEDVQEKVQIATAVLEFTVMPINFLSYASTVLFCFFTISMLLLSDPVQLNRLRKNSRIRRRIKVCKLICCTCDKKFKKVIKVDQNASPTVTSN